MYSVILISLLRGVMKFWSPLLMSLNLLLIVGSNYTKRLIEICHLKSRRQLVYFYSPTPSGVISARSDTAARAIGHVTELIAGVSMSILAPCRTRPKKMCLLRHMFGNILLHNISLMKMRITTKKNIVFILYEYDYRMKYVFCNILYIIRFSNIMSQCSHSKLV